MTISEIDKLLALLEAEGAAATIQYLQDVKLVAQPGKGLIQVQIANLKQEPVKTVAAFPLSENLCVISGRNGNIEPFKSFRSLVRLTHIGTGSSVYTLKISKASALRMAEQLEAMLDWSGKTVDEVKNQPREKLQAVMALIRSFDEK